MKTKEGKNRKEWKMWALCNEKGVPYIVNKHKSIIKSLHKDTEHDSIKKVRVILDE